jgi:hypothetical protein
MHQTPASVNAFYASSMALHFWPIFDPSNPKTAEIRHFFPQAPSKLLNFSLSIARSRNAEKHCQSHCVHEEA